MAKQFSKYFYVRQGSLGMTSSPEDFRNTIANRKVKVMHALIYAERHLQERGWDKTVRSNLLNWPADLTSILDQACRLRLDSGNDALTQRAILYKFLDDVAAEMSRNKYKDVLSWEQAQRAAVNVEKLIRKARLNCAQCL